MATEVSGKPTTLHIVVSIGFSSGLIPCTTQEEEVPLRGIKSLKKTVVGDLVPLNENISREELLEAIYYERDIELIQTGFGIAFFDMRRRDMLQYGTMLHFPIPGKDLMAMELPEYTFGGEANADGINTSNGGWFPEK